MNKNSILHKTLARALSMMRPHNSEGTRRMTDWLQENAPAHAKVHRDEVGNLHIDTRISTTNRTLFTAHVDTVHRKEGPNKIRKTNTHWYAEGAPLGADDGAGCAMLMHLLHSGVDAYYLFTQGEECGGIGARHVARDTTLLSQFDRAIAFDRRGIDSVITHQGWGRTASDSFAQALADSLNKDDRLMYLPDDTGVYTDTAEFIDVIPECTNISVGYAHEHSDRESLDIVHFLALAERVVNIDWDGLPTDRDPTEIETFGSRMDRWSDYGEYWGVGGKATSVSSLSGSHWLLDDDDEAWELEGLRDAIYDAMAGNKQWLVELLAETVYPEDPEMAEMFIDRRKLDGHVLAEALDNCKTYDPDTVLCCMFDQVYKEA